MKHFKKYSTKELIVAIIIAIILAFILLSFFVLNSTAIYKGVTINGIPVDGLSTVEASQYLEKHFQKTLINQKFKLYYKEYILEVKYEDIGAAYDYYSASKKAFQIGREGNTASRLKSIFYTRFYGEDINMEIIYDNNKISSIINTVKTNINYESKDAEIRIINDKPVITPESVGRIVQEDILKERIIDSLMRSNVVEIPVIESIPRLTEEILNKITSKTAVFSTSFSGSTDGRIHNIKLASKAINGNVILPGEIFSFNNTTGNRDSEAGYKDSIVIVDGDYAAGVGGGVCQVSTTLYNAALLSDMEIIERHPHSIPASYVDRGRDAAVAYNYLDLKFRNTIDAPIYLRTRINSNTLIIDIFSKKNDNGKTVKIETDIVEKIEPDIEETVDELLAPGDKVVVQKGRYGYKVKTYKVIFYNGNKTDRELITSDYYKSRKYIIKKGPELDIVTEEEDENGGVIH